MHDVLTRENWEGANLKALLDEVAAPQTNVGNARFVIDGPDVLLPAQLALSLSIAFHELCTNASKYGALSNADGHVAVTWALKNDGGNRAVEIVWEERRGPEVMPPEQRGFGTRVVERTLNREHDAKVNLEFRRSGVRCWIEAPLTAAQ